MVILRHGQCRSGRGLSVARGGLPVARGGLRPGENPLAASVVAYLVKAGRAAPVDGAGTVLAGWDPDLTYWLTDTLTLAGPVTDWVRLDQEPLGWSQKRDQRD
jgi:hypothetical protein